MKQFMILSLAAGLMATSSCSTRVSEKVPGLDLSNLDTTVACGDDFYQYACGGWMVKNPLKPEYARYGSFDMLRDNNKEQIKALFEELGKTKSESGSVAQKVGDFYTMGLDSVRLNKEGASPMEVDLAEIKTVSGKEAVSKLLAKMHRTVANPFFALFVDADMKNSSMNIANIYQSGMNMGDRDYYWRMTKAPVKFEKAILSTSIKYLHCPDILKPRQQKRQNQ